MTKAVVSTPQADFQILRLDEWWRESRDKAPELFEQELATALRTISVAPNAGKRYPHPMALVRRGLMRSTRNDVYYVEIGDRVLIVAVWGAVQGMGPDLSSV